MNKRSMVFIVISVITLLTAGYCCDANAQLRFGVKGGLNFSALTDIDLGSINGTLDKSTAWHAGVAMQIRVPIAGIAIQPELLYTRKSSAVEYGPADASSSVIDIKMDYFELPVNIQVGLDMILLRPYLQFSPYIGYAIGKKFKSVNEAMDIDWEDLTRFNYGVGIGGGLDIWKFQLSLKYNWSFGSLGKEDKFSDAVSMKRIMNGKFNGLELSLLYFF